MIKQGRLKHYISLCLLFTATPLHASIIESTIGTAVVNDATATYYNPAALTLLKNKQLVTIGTYADYHTRFQGQTTQVATNFTQTGTSNATTQYYLPSFYAGIPTAHNITVGLGVIYNYFSREVADDAVLRYVQANNRVQDINLIPAFGIKVNNTLALGAGLDVSHIDFLLQPVSGFPTLGISDVKNHNASSGTSYGAHFGFLLTPSAATTVGFNYRTGITYDTNGESIYEGTPKLVSKHYHYQFWTPARSVLSMNQFVTPKLGFIGTVQYIQWNIFNTIHLHNVATRTVTAATIIPNATAHFHLHNAWLFTLGTHYRITPQWVVRAAASYNESPATGNYQLSDSDTYILAASTGYDFNKYITLDFGYAHAFIQNQSIHIVTARNNTNGTLQAFRDAFSLKLTLNV